MGLLPRGPCQPGSHRQDWPHRENWPSPASALTSLHPRAVELSTPVTLSPAASPASRAPFDPLAELPLRFITGTALFDGHDASIHVFRRLLQRGGAEVVHLGHNRAAGEIAAAALEEDADAIAVSSYQGGHNEFFRYLVDLLREAGRGDIRVFGGGGGVIRPEEGAALEAYGVARIYSPGDDRVDGIEGIVADMLADAGEARAARPRVSFDSLSEDLAGEDPLRRNGAAARLISLAESEGLDAADRAALSEHIRSSAPVLGITGTGGAGKSSVLDELLVRFRTERPDLGSGSVSRIGVLAVDPSKRRTGGALLGDRIRLNAIGGTEVFVRSLATRHSGTELANVVDDALLILRAAGCGLLVVETGGIGQGDSRIVDISDFSLYVMTSDYGAESQLEKIDMLDLADAVALNKADHPGAEDALFAVRRAFQRARSLPRHAPVPVLPTVASRFADPGLDRLYAVVRDGLAGRETALPSPVSDRPDDLLADVRLIPPARAGYLAEIADTLRGERNRVAAEADRAARIEHLEAALDELRAGGGAEEAARALEARLREVRAELDAGSRELLAGWSELVARYRAPRYRTQVRDRVREFSTHRETLSGTWLPRVALPGFTGNRDRLRFLLEENLPGHYPFTAGVFPFRREERVRGVNSPGKAARRAPTGGSTCSPIPKRPRGSRSPSTA